MFILHVLARILKAKPDWLSSSLIMLLILISITSCSGLGTKVELTPTPDKMLFAEAFWPVCENAFSAQVEERGFSAPVLSIRHKMYLGGTDLDWLVGIPFGVMSPDEIRTIECIRKERESVSGYTGGIDAYMIRWDICLVTLPEEIVIACESFRGIEPPEETWIREGSEPEAIYGIDPDSGEISSWMISIFSKYDPAAFYYPSTKPDYYGVEDVAFSPDGSILAACNKDGTIKLWNLETNEEANTLGRHGERVTSIAFSPDGETLVSGSWDYTVKVWSVATGEEIRTLRGHTYYVEDVAFSPDGKIIASASWDDTVKLWDATTGEEIHTLTGSSEVYALAFVPDHGTLATGNGDGYVTLWDVESGEEIWNKKVHKWSTQGLAASPDGATLASSESDFEIILLDTEKGKKIETVRERTEYLGGTRPATNTDVVFSPDGKTLAWTDIDSCIRLYDIANQEVQTLCGYPGPRNELSFSPDGGKLASNGFLVVTIWDVDTRP